MGTKVIFRGSKEQLRKALSSLPVALAGGPDPYLVAQSIQLTAGLSLLSQIEEDFKTKSRGGTGRDGITWKPLLRSTIAQRRIGAGDLNSIGIKSAGQPKSRVRGLLTKAQDKRWRGIFASTLAKARMHMGEAEAKEYAAKKAWAILKSEGAKTKLDVLGGRQVDIGRDTGRLLRSLTAGVDIFKAAGGPVVDEQILETPPGRVIVGTNVPYATKFSEVRPFWPPGGNLPEPWAVDILAVVDQAIVKAVVIIAQQGPR